MDNDALLESFEQRLFEGDKPVLEDFVRGTNDSRTSLLEELVHIEFEFRLKAGDQVRVEDYWQRFPELTEDERRQWEMIAVEFTQRRRREPDLALAEFVQRFPRWQNELRALTGALSSRQGPGTVHPSTNPSVQSTWTDRTGEVPVISGYEIEGELGKGGMGVVYKARQIVLKRSVALKFVRRDLGDGQAIARFRTEAEAAARLDHPNIVKIYDYGVSDGRPYLALEFLEGGTLSDRIKGRPQSGKEAARLVETLARAVQAAHAKGIIHRDLKPANILLQEPGVRSAETGANADAIPGMGLLTHNSMVPKITDFGLAKLVDADQYGTDAFRQRTSTGAILGTPAYMAPEQAAGARAIGPAADLWALGAILYELVTGRPPFQGTSSAETLLSVLHDEPLPPRRLQPKLARDLETICLQCLAKKPERRYVQAAALAEDLRRFQAGEAIQARAPGVVERGMRWTRRHPVWASLAAVGMLALVAASAVLVAFTTYLQHALAERTTELRNQHQERQREREAVARARRLADWRAASALQLRMAHDYLGTGEVAKCRDVLTKLEPPADEDDFRSTFPWGFLWRQCDHLRWSHEGGHIAIHCLALSPDGSMVATGHEHNGCIHFWNSEGNHVGLVETHAGATVQVAFGPDGRTLAAASADGKVRLVDCRMRKLCDVLPLDAVKALAFNVDGTQVLGVGAQSRIDIWSVARHAHERSLHGSLFARAGGPKQELVVYAAPVLEIRDARGDRVVRRLPVHEKVSALAYSADERTIALGLESGLIRLLDVDTGTIKRTLAGHTAPVRQVTFSPDGSLLVTSASPYVGQDLTVRVWNSSTGQARCVLRGHRAGVTGLAFTPDSRSLMTVSLDDTVKRWALDDQEAGAPLTPTLAPLGPVAFGADGRALAVADSDGTVKVLDEVSLQVTRRLLRARLSAVSDIAWSPVDRYLAVGGMDGVLEVWEMASGRQVLSMRAHQDKIERLAFAPDGQTLATAGADAVVNVFEVPTGRVRHRLTAHTAAVTDLDFSPDGRMLVTVSLDGSVRRWDTLSGTAVAVSETDAVRAVRFHPDGSTFVIATESVLALRDAVTGKPVREFHGFSAPPVLLRFAQNGSVLLGRDEDALQAWDTRTGARRFRLPLARQPGKLACTGATVAAASEDGSLILLDLQAMSVRYVAGSLPRDIEALEFTADGKSLAVLSGRTPDYCRMFPALASLLGPGDRHYEVALPGSGLAPVSFWDTATGRPRTEIPSPFVDMTLSCLRLDRGGNILAAGSGGTVWAWERSNDRYRAQPPRFINDGSKAYWKVIELAQRAHWPTRPEFKDHVRALAMSGNGRVVATASDQGWLQLWDGPTWQPLHTFARDFRDCHALALTPDGQTLVAASGAVLHLWRVTDGSRLGTLAGHEQLIRAVTISGQVLASAGDDGTIRLWDLAERRATQMLRGHTQPVAALAFAPDGQTLASGGSDRTVKLWNLLANQEVMSLVRHSGKVTCLAFTPDGATLASAGESPAGAGEVFLWHGKSLGTP